MLALRRVDRQPVVVEPGRAAVRVSSGTGSVLWGLLIGVILAGVVGERATNMNEALLLELRCLSEPVGLLQVMRG